MSSGRFIPGEDNEGNQDNRLLMISISIVSGLLVILNTKINFASF